MVARPHPGRSLHWPGTAIAPPAPAFTRRLWQPPAEQRLDFGKGEGDFRQAALPEMLEQRPVFGSRFHGGFLPPTKNKPISRLTVPAPRLIAGLMNNARLMGLVGFTRRSLV